MEQKVLIPNSTADSDISSLVADIFFSTCLFSLLNSTLQVKSAPHLELFGVKGDNIPLGT